MTKVSQREATVASNTSVTKEVYSVAFWAVAGAAVLIGVVSLAALVVGIAKVVVALLIGA